MGGLNVLWFNSSTHSYTGRRHYSSQFECFEAAAAKYDPKTSLNSRHMGD